ncbi:hypothetical protein PCANC_08870 [Puccinia coronata f. sp. avenae]|uniref:Uncharacterized protein n=1 Tax=Puccinia coronata f. sp. avenae TaxID=200324 RepID=A0A2N5VS34_9BASI|nr:hypothetical protein PCANC_08870 [Puccinia coronata f. sp. avenae]
MIAPDKLSPQLPVDSHCQIQFLLDLSSSDGTWYPLAGTQHPPAGTLEGEQVPADGCLVRVQVSISGEIRHRYPHPQHVPGHFGRELTELNELGQLTKFIELSQPTEIGQLTEFIELGQLTEFIEFAHWSSMSSVGSPSSLELNELDWLTELIELGWVPAGTCHLYAGTCHLYAGTCHLYAGTCRRKCGLRKDKATQEAAKVLAARKPKKPVAAPKEPWLHG